jgi:chromosome partitioning protein
VAAKRIALINMKGGVGKSTLTVNLAWQLSGVVGRDNNVLVVDLDPQFNASQYLLGTVRYKRAVMDHNRPTVWDVFEEQTRTPGHANPTPLRPADAIVNIATWSTHRLDLLPSRLELTPVLSCAQADSRPAWAKL